MLLAGVPKPTAGRHISALEQMRLSKGSATQVVESFRANDWL